MNSKDRVSGGLSEEVGGSSGTELIALGMEACFENTVKSI